MMRQFTSTLSILLVLFAAFLATGEESVPDSKKLQGTWELVAGVRAEEELNNSQLRVYLIEFKNDEMTLRGTGNVIKGKFTVDPAKSPKVLDLTVTKPEQAVVPFIYELDGDKLKLCWTYPTQARPTKFSKEGTAGLFSWERAIDKSSEDAKAFQGKWQAVRREINGKKTPAQMLSQMVYTFTDKTFTIEVAGKKVGEGSFKVDSSSIWKKHIDLTLQGAMLLGSFEFEKERLSICYSNKGDDVRPETLGTFPNTDQDLTLVTLQKLDEAK